VKLFSLLEKNDPSLDSVKKAAVELWVQRGVVDRGLLLRDDLVAFLREHLRVREAFPDTVLTSLDRWRFLESKAPRRRLVLDTIWKHFARPVIDTQVTLESVHLLKTPFSLHSSTGRIALPIPLAALGTVDPARMPTARDLAAHQPEAEALFRSGCDTLRQWLSECGY
jgi:hypothetical protein